MNISCPYCQTNAKLVNGTVIYPHRSDLADKKFWHCAPCDAYVGTHANSPSHAPLGRIANLTLRKAKQGAHAAFDPLWQSGKMTRKGAYFWMAEILNLEKSQAHIGMFTVEQCDALVKAINNLNSTQLKKTAHDTSPWSQFL